MLMCFFTYFTYLYLQAFRNHQLNQLYFTNHLRKIILDHHKIYRQFSVFINRYTTRGAKALTSAKLTHDLRCQLSDGLAGLAFCRALIGVQLRDHNFNGIINPVLYPEGHWMALDVRRTSSLDIGYSVARTLQLYKVPFFFFFPFSEGRKIIC